MKFIVANTSLLLTYKCNRRPIIDKQACYSFSSTDDIKDAIYIYNSACLAQYLQYYEKITVTSFMIFVRLISSLVSELQTSTDLFFKKYEIIP